MKDNGILVMGFLFAWEAYKGALSTATLLPVQRKAWSSPCLGWQQQGVRDTAAALAELRELQRAGSSVRHRWAALQHPAMALPSGWAPMNTKLVAWLSCTGKAKIHLSCWFRVLVTLPGPLPSLRHSPALFPPRLTFRLWVCWSSAYFCSPKHF